MRKIMGKSAQEPWVCASHAGPQKGVLSLGIDGALGKLGWDGAGGGGPWATNWVSGVASQMGSGSSVMSEISKEQGVCWGTICMYLS